MKLTEIPKNSVPDFFVVTSEGTIAESQVPQVLGSADAAQLLSYEISFDVKPLIGGFEFLVLSDTQNKGILIACNTDDRTVSAHYGSTTMSTLVSSTALPSNLTMSPDIWHSVKANVDLTGISVLLDDVQVMHFSQQLSFYGSFGFGASFGHKAIFRDLNVATPEGQTVYANSLKDSTFLADFFSGTNPSILLLMVHDVTVLHILETWTSPVLLL